MEKKEILEKAKQRLEDMKFNLAFYKLIYEKNPIEQIKIKISRLKMDIIELENELELVEEKVDIDDYEDWEEFKLEYLEG